MYVFVRTESGNAIMCDCSCCCCCIFVSVSVVGGLRIYQLLQSACQTWRVSMQCTYIILNQIKIHVFFIGISVYACIGGNRHQ